MMLQGHFVDSLLDNAFRDNSNIFYNIWQYFRGITAPVFFTVSGFIFTYLLVKVPQKGFENPRVKKGIKRGLQLLFIGYLLRMNLFGLLNGDIYDSFYLVDVLHCIGLSILGIIGIYLLTQRTRNYVFPLLLVGATVLLFVFEPVYKQFTYALLPDAIANYFTKSNGSVFTILPWFGYTTFGAFLSLLFTRYKNFKYLYPTAITLFTLVGLGLIFYSSPFFLAFSRFTGIQLFADIYFNNYLFIRLGDVLVAFSIFMLFRQFLMHQTFLRLGQNTLSIYVVHFVILYGSFTGLGLYYFLNHSLSPYIAIPGAIAFMIVCSYAALQYDKHEQDIKLRTGAALQMLWSHAEPWYTFTLKTFRVFFLRFLRLIRVVKN